MKTRLAIISTHPIQYYAPVFKLLSEHITVKVFYTWGEEVLKQKYDPGFNKVIEWDIPLLNGYDYLFSKNIAEDPGSHHKNGIINPHIISEITDFNPTSILIYGYNYHSHLQIIKHFYKKVPLYFRGDSTLLDNESLLKKILKKIYLQWTYHHFNTIFYVGEANKAYFKNYGVKEDQLIFAPHAIDNERFCKPTNSELIRQQLGATDKDMVILFAGKFEDKKNPMLLLQAFIELNHPNAYLLFVGNGNLEPELKRLAESSNNTSRIFFEGFKNQSQLPAYYQACDIFCLPSKGPGETWGLAINEAMAAGKAILASDKVGCTRNLVFNHQNGLTFTSNNLKELSQFLSSLLDKKKLIKMGLLSKEIINNYTFEKQVKSIIENIK